MTETFTFVSVNLTKSNAAIRRRGAGIAAEDRSKIRSLAARNPANRPSSGQITVHERKSVLQKRLNKLRESSTPECPGLTDDAGSPSSDSEDETCIPDKRSRSTQNPPSARSTELQVVNRTRKGFQAFSTNVGWRLPAHLRAETLDPFWTLCIPQFHLVSELLDHRIKFLMPAIPELDLRVTGHLEDRVSMQFFKKFMDVPCFMWMQLLYAAGHMRACIENSCRFDQVSKKERKLLESEELILWLKGCAVSALHKTFNEKLDDLELDGRISAVMTLSAYEKCFGNADSYNSHMAAVRQLVSQKGGMQGVNPLTRKLMNWLAGTSVGLGDCYPESNLYEIQPPLNEFAAEVIGSNDFSLEETDMTNTSESFFNQGSLSPESVDTVLDKYPDMPFSTVAEERWIAFAEHLNKAALCGSSTGDRQHPFIVERDSRGGFIAHTIPL